MKEQSYTNIFNNRGHDYNEAGSFAPLARERERQGIIQRLCPAPAEVIVDAPAGGGYVAEAVFSLSPESQVICIEPAEKFAGAIPDTFQLLIEQIEDTSLENSSVDAIASLAGLHHFTDKVPVFQEWQRLLKLGGRLIVADVAKGSKTGEFLNGFVDQYTPGGHDGYFFESGEFSNLLEKTGFEEVEEELCDVPWCFESEENMLNFCSKLFSITDAPRDQLLSALHEVGVESINGEIQLRWQLLYAQGVRNN